jgi:hypothetical protein
MDAPSGDANDPVNRQLAAWQDRRDEYLSRRLIWSQVATAKPPWEDAKVVARDSHC